MGPSRRAPRVSRRAELDRGLAPADGGQERDGQVRLEVLPVPRTGGATAAPAAADPAEQLLEDPPTGMGLVGRRPRSCSRPRPTGAEEIAEVEGEAGTRLVRGPLGGPARGPGAAIPSKAALPYRS